MVAPRNRLSGSMGFTLLELLIAIAIFALIGMATYQMLTTVLRTDSVTRAQEQRLRELVRAMGAFERDLQQAWPRAVRAPYGDMLPALQGVGRGRNEVLSFTRGGWSNPAGARRSSLQRVRWQVSEGSWQRHYWLVLDQAQDSQPQEQRVLEGVRGWRLRYLDRQGNWLDSWPRELFFAQEAFNELPRAVELVLDHQHYGSLRRVFRLPDVLFTGAAEELEWPEEEL